MVLRVQYKTVFKRVNYLIIIKTTLEHFFFEASPLLYKLSSISVETFHDFAFVFYQHVNLVAEGFQSLDAVFDYCFSNSLTSQTRIGQ